jgi:hypothetical protein
MMVASRNGRGRALARGPRISCLASGFGGEGGRCLLAHFLNERFHASDHRRLDLRVTIAPDVSASPFETIDTPSGKERHAAAVTPWHAAQSGLAKMLGPERLNLLRAILPESLEALKR